MRRTVLQLGSGSRSGRKIPDTVIYVPVPHPTVWRLSFLGDLIARAVLLDDRHYLPDAVRVADLDSNWTCLSDRGYRGRQGHYRREGKCYKTGDKNHDDKYKNDEDSHGAIRIARQLGCSS